MSNEYVISVASVRTKKYLGFLRFDGSTTKKKADAARYNSADADREIRLVRAYGNYFPRKVKA